MSPRARMTAIVAVVALVGAGAVIGITVVSSDEPTQAAAPAPPVRAGAPPVSIDLGVRTDTEAVDLREALRLYDAGNRAAAAKLFARHDSLEARVGEAFSRWPDGTLDRVTQLAGLHPKSALIQLNLGLARFWSGVDGPKEAWRSAAELEPDSAYAVTAGNLLYPGFARGLPLFVPAAGAPRGLSRLSPPAQFRELAQRAAAGDRGGTLFYGVALQSLGRQRSAERVFAALARRRPNDAEAQVAAAVGTFDKADPATAFSKLGPLTRRFPKAATTRFHLGLLLLWSGELKEARRQLRLARTIEPGSPLATQAKRYLAELTAAGI